MNMGGLRIAFMQSMCIANGDQSVSVNGQMDNATLAAFDRFAAKYGVKNRSYPNFELFRALHENRLLDRAVAAAAWNAFTAYKSGVIPQTAPAVAAKSVQPKPAPTASRSKPKPKRDSAGSSQRIQQKPVSEPDTTDSHQDLLP